MVHLSITHHQETFHEPGCKIFSYGQPHVTGDVKRDERSRPSNTEIETQSPAKICFGTLDTGTTTNVRNYFSSLFQRFILSFVPGVPGTKDLVRAIRRLKLKILQRSLSKHKTNPSRELTEFHNELVSNASTSLDTSAFFSDVRPGPVPNGCWLRVTASAGMGSLRFFHPGTSGCSPSHGRRYQSYLKQVMCSQQSDLA
ncbi:hypothetical protein T03_4125 [Trichinella britovi]|uniref:Uncharacterized protein n=1 Tax=Trichinella britovi TaxID=45882 RepID=A0A0V1CD98_TRIBR|nr:hypothetical protein T03_4125 [Trichinella britovi]